MQCQYVKLRQAVRTTKARGWCGPTAISALTGVTVEEAKNVIRQVREAEYGGNNGWTVTGVSEPDMFRALTKLGVEFVERYGPAKSLTLRQFLKSRRAEWTTDPLLVIAGHHYCVVQGGAYVCSLTKGEVVFIEDAPRLKARVRVAYRLRKKA